MKPCNVSPATPGPATSANCKTSSNAPSCSRPGDALQLAPDFCPAPRRDSACGARSLSGASAHTAIRRHSVASCPGGCSSGRCDGGSRAPPHSGGAGADQLDDRRRARRGEDSESQSEHSPQPDEKPRHQAPGPRSRSRRRNESATTCQSSSTVLPQTAGIPAAQRHATEDWKAARRPARP